MLPSPPCNPAGTVLSSNIECDRCHPATSLRIGLRHTPPNCNARSPPRHHHHCRCRGRWRHCRRHRRPVIVFPACCGNGGEDRCPHTRSAGLPPPLPDRGVTSLPNNDPAAGPLRRQRSTGASGGGQEGEKRTPDPPPKTQQGGGHCQPWPPPPPPTTPQPSRPLYSSPSCRPPRAI